MTEPLIPDFARRTNFSVAEYASVFLVDVNDVSVRTGPNASVTYDDVDRHVWERKRLCNELGVGVDANGRVDWASASRPGRPRPVAQQQTASGPQVVTRTVAEMNAQAYADPELHRAAYALGIKDIKPPETVYTGWVDPGAAWNPKPQLVDNGDGTAQWVTPQANLDQPDSVFEKAKEIHKPGWTWDQDA